MIAKKVFKAALTQRVIKLVLRDDGAVTIFAVIVLSSLLLFFSLLIDYARIAALHKVTEDSVRSGVRSVLSAYDSTLYEKYGLFGRGGTAGQVIFNEAVASNVEGSMIASEKNVKLARSKLEAATLDTAAVLGNHDIFTRQVLEEMKYKAPVDFTLELVARFVPMAGAMKEASVAMDLLESMRKLYERREAHLTKALQLQQEAADAVHKSDISARIPMHAALGSGGNTAVSIANEYDLYASQVVYDMSITGEELPKYTNEIAAYEAKARSGASELLRQSTEMLKRNIKLLGDALLEVEAAKVLNDEMELLVQKANEASADSSYDTIAKREIPGSELHDMPSSTESDIEHIKQSANELLLTESWFSTYRKEIDAQDAASFTLNRDVESFQSIVSASLMRPIANSSADALINSVSNMRLAYGLYEESYIRPAAILEERKKMLHDSDVKKQLKQQEAQADSLWQKARGMLNRMTNVKQTDEQEKLFDQVKAHYNNNLLFNQQTDATKEQIKKEEPNDVYAASENSTALMGNMFTGLAEMLEGARNSLYFGEYTIQRYTSFAPQKLRSLVETGDTKEFSNAISFHNQEAEYVIYGFHNSVANLAAAYGELFAARLAIRTMEGLVENRTLGHPLLILSAALIYGLGKTLEDMIAFTERGSAPLSKYVKVELSYIDYLRLFQLMHGANETSRLARMIAVIEQNSGNVLSAVPSAVTGEARFSMELWFVPGLMRTLGHFGLLQGKVVGNRYETTQTIGLSY